MVVLIFAVISLWCERYPGKHIRTLNGETDSRWKDVLAMSSLANELLIAREIPEKPSVIERYNMTTFVFGGPLKVAGLTYIADMDSCIAACECVYIADWWKFLIFRVTVRIPGSIYHHSFWGLNDRLSAQWCNSVIIVWRG